MDERAQPIRTYINNAMGSSMASSVVVETHGTAVTIIAPAFEMKHLRGRLYRSIRHLTPDNWALQFEIEGTQQS